MAITVHTSQLLTLCTTKYGKEIILKFYTSYHAFGRADGSGAEDSVSLRQDGKKGFPRYGALAFTQMTNDSTDRRSWAYHFEKINRHLSLFPAGVNAKSKNLRKWSEVVFDYPERTPDHLGICLYRYVTGQGVWIWCDLLEGSREAGKELCETCSTSKQSLVFHTVEQCPRPQNIHALPDFMECEPDPDRIDMAQQKQRPRNRGEKESKMMECKLGCKSASGRPQRFRKACTANTHYQLVHKLQEGDSDYEKVREITADPEQKDNDSQPSNVGSDLSSAKKIGNLKRPQKSSLASKKKTDTDTSSDEAAGSSEDEIESGPAEDQVLGGHSENDEYEDEQFEIAAILASRKMRCSKPGQYEYKVQWKHYPPEETTWEPKESFKAGAQWILTTYLAEQQEKNYQKPGGKQRRRR